LQSATLGLPAGWYCEPAHASLEAAAIFTRSWQFVCHAADLPAPGTAARFDSAGRSLFVLRTAAGEFRAFRNACAHRGARLIEGDAHTGLAFCLDQRVRCPYHGWTYDDSGALLDAGAHVGSAQDPARSALHPAAVETWRGLVFAAFAPPAVSLEQWIGTVGAEWPELMSLRRLAEPLQQPIAADWKLACEHLLDVAQRNVAQPRSRPQAFGAAVDAGANEHAFAATAALAVSDDAPWSARVYRRLVAALQEAPAREHWLYVWPNALLQLTPDGLRVRQLLPAAAGASVLRELRYGMPDSSRAMRRLRYAHLRLQRRARQEDVRLLARVQQGVASLEPAETLGAAHGGGGLAWFDARCRTAVSPVAAETGPAPVPARRQRSTRRPAATSA
jgi:choline monooxygenase